MKNQNIVFYFKPLLLLLFTIMLFSCEKDSVEEKVTIKKVSLNQFFTMEPGDIVQFSEPFQYSLMLEGFEDFAKQENTLATATAKFKYTVNNGFGGLLLYVAQDQGGEGPISFFSGCSAAKISDGNNGIVDVFFIIDEVTFKEDAFKFSFSKIRLKMILKESNPEYFCTF
ncbi:hypothetical protein [Arenibacter certesii]|nr:hypothetical protein [Arenibacter certesii]